MNQLTLFDVPQLRARKRDPETSKIAAAEIEPKLNRLQQEFFDTLGQSSLPMTSNEVAAEIVSEAFMRAYQASRESFRKRAGELVALGRIEVCGKRKCKVTGKLAQVYKITGGAK